MGVTVSIMDILVSRLWPVVVLDSSGTFVVLPLVAAILVDLELVLVVWVWLVARDRV